jgi:hypothetical protein
VTTPTATNPADLTHAIVRPTCHVCHGLGRINRVPVQPVRSPFGPKDIRTLWAKEAALQEGHLAQIPRAIPGEYASAEPCPACRALGYGPARLAVFPKAGR